MTNLLEKAFAEAAKLPTSEQDALANWILAELEAERRWQDTFATSGDWLSQMAREALEEHHAGQTGELNPDEL